MDWDSFNLGVAVGIIITLAVLLLCRKFYERLTRKPTG